VFSWQHSEYAGISIHGHQAIVIQTINEIIVILVSGTAAVNRWTSVQLCIAALEALQVAASAWQDGDMTKASRRVQLVVIVRR